jgi:3-phosphoshikimate 1-carboxyvinyltransferase
MYKIRPCLKVQGVIKNIPGDKSISHRAVIISSLAQGNTLIKNFSFSKDCLATLNAFKSLGVRIDKVGKNAIFVYGGGIFGLHKPKAAINLGESGTTMRILIGLLCGQNFAVTLKAGKSLNNRPMHRVIGPLRVMGAKIKAKVKNKDEFAPLKILPANLKAISWQMKIPSAQVKSAILLASLYAKGQTKIYEPIKSRDHTERMLKLFKANINKKGRNIFIRPSDLVSPGQFYIPSDISSASFFIVLACLLNNSRLKINNVSLNPARCGVIRVLKKMGAGIKIVYKKKNYFEPMADLVIGSSKLKGVIVQEDEIPSLIDELPILMVAASLARGHTVFKGIGELRVKETDRIKAMLINLSKMGVSIKTKKRGRKEDVIIEGGHSLQGANLKSFGDHRTTMSMIMAGLCAKSPSVIDDIKCICKSFPDFLRILKPILRY